jgi:hypothetical protein
MAMIKWEVQIEGDAADLAYLTIHCNAPPLLITKQADDSYRLYHQDFDAFDRTQSPAVFECARSIARTLSGALEHCGKRGSPALKIGSALGTDSDGYEHIVMEADTGNFKTTGGWSSGSIGTTDGSEPPTMPLPKVLRLELPPLPTRISTLVPDMRLAIERQYGHRGRHAQEARAD